MNHRLNIRNRKLNNTVDSDYRDLYSKRYIHDIQLLLRYIYDYYFGLHSLLVTASIARLVTIVIDSIAYLLLPSSLVYCYRRHISLLFIIYFPAL